jgi:hypothetical protein
MAPWTFDVKFPRGTEFTFGSLTFATGEDGDLRMLPPGKVTEHTTPSSASSEIQPNSDLFDVLYIRTVKTCPRDPGRDDYPPAMCRSIEFVLIDPVLRSRVIRRLPRDRGQHLRKLRRHQPPHLYGGSKRRSAPPQLQRVSHHQEV